MEAIQDAFGGATNSPADEPNLGVSELTALSVIGYNLIPKVTPPPFGVSNVSYKIGSSVFTNLRGHTHDGDTVDVTFTVVQPAGEQLTLVSYQAPAATFSAATADQQTVLDSVSAFYKPGTYTVTLKLPSNGHYQIDFVAGSVITKFGPAGSKTFYSAEDRLISADNE